MLDPKTMQSGRYRLTCDVKNLLGSTLATGAVFDVDRNEGEGGVFELVAWSGRHRQPLAFGRGGSWSFADGSMGLGAAMLAETPSEALFERLAAENPQRLLAMLVANELRPALLTYAAEIAGRTLPSEMCVPVLVPLLYHESALVREGTVYGLAEHLDELVTSELRKVSNNDSSAGVRAAATGTLEGR